MQSHRPVAWSCRIVRLDFEDLRQPGLNIRTPMNMDRLSDEEMIDYYSKLIIIMV